MSALTPENPIVGGTTLLVPAIQSPNFVHGSSGWAIFQNGSAEFNSITVPTGTGGGVTTFIQATTPTAVNIGDLWINTSNGNQLSRWNGSVWTAISWNGADVISPGTITAALLVANIVVAGIVDATTITGSTFVGGTWDGTDFIFNSNGLFIYNGTPALGNLLATVAPANGTDGLGNVYKKGIVAYSLTNSSAYSQLLGGEITMVDGVGNDYNFFPTIAVLPGPAPQGLTLGSSKNLGNSPNIPILSATEPNSLASAKWHTISLATGWSVGTDSNGASYPPQYKLLPHGALAIQGCLVTPSTGTVIGVAFNSVGIAAGYMPASGSNLPTATITQANGGHTGQLELHPNGNLELQGGFTTGNNVRLDCTIQIA